MSCGWWTRKRLRDAITDEIAVLMITEVDYRTGRKHDMKALTEKAHAHGVLTVWDLAHSAGAQCRWIWPGARRISPLAAPTNT